MRFDARFDAKGWLVVLIATMVMSAGAAGAATLQLVAETKISALGVAALPHSEYEASGVYNQGGFLYVIFDNSFRILKVKPDWTSASLTTVSNDSASQYEGITYDSHNTATFPVMIESASHNSANTGEVNQYNTSLSSKQSEWTNVTFKKSNKGFEGVAWLWRCPSGSTQGNDYLLGLCEANDCDDVGNTGHGRVKVMQQVTSGSSIGWSLITNGTLSIPSVANFGDYSDIALDMSANPADNCSGGTGVYTAAVVSQESSQLWIGTFNANTWVFQGGTVYDFPKNQNGQTIYCNIEGVTFLSATQIAVASDAKKSDQPSECSTEDQSLHIFNIPS
jgi:hypothetical protein